ncbi:MAG: hypothetical protein LPJ91_05885 [Pseudazoarcus pumilus]|nr:hypothetical protein [Pseudazoarcus pumilus]
MRIFSFFSRSDANAYAEGLAVDLTRDLPPKLILKSASIISANRVTTILERSYEKASTFQSEQNMNGFQRAAFANTFRWKLDEIGYPEEFVRVATEGLLVHLSRSVKTGGEG